MTDQPPTRQSAIDSLVRAWEQREAEFGLSSERRASTAELITNLQALGVTDDELAEAGL